MRLKIIHSSTGAISETDVMLASASNAIIIGFHVDVCQMVRNHVKAKRYLVSTSPFYYETLSEASKATLLEQNGMMNFSEQVEFENERLFHESILVRKFDDSAKPTEDAVMQTFNFLWKTYIQHCV